MAERYSKRARMQYRFDNMMSRGTSSKLKLLLTVTVIYILVVGLVAAFLTNNNDGGVFQTLWKMMLYVIGKGVPALDNSSPLYIALALLSVFYCLFFTAILIGLINQGIRNKVDELGKGRGRVIEEGHTLILGFNEATFVLLEQLIEANRNQPRPETVVILDDIDRADMVDAVQRRLGPTWKRPQTRLICRTGLYYSFDDLRRCSIETSRVVIVNTMNDFDAIKAIMACSHVLNESDIDNDPYIVAAIDGEESVIESRIAGRSSNVNDRLELLPFNEVLARVMVHTSRQPGLSDVFTELFNYEDDEFYIIGDDPSFPKLWGRSVAEINRVLLDSYAVGVVHDGEVVVDAPHGVVFVEGDSLIVVEEDDDDLRVLDKPAPVESLKAEEVQGEQVINVLVLGVQPILDNALVEYAKYLQADSKIIVADRVCDLNRVLSDETRTSLANAGIELQTRDADIYRGKELVKLLDETRPSCVLVLTDHHSDDPNADDERVFRILLHLREYRSSTGCHYSITSEMHLLANKQLASLTEPDDFIISKELAALVMVQISQERKTAKLFDVLLSEEGFEVYIKPAVKYIPIGVPVDLVSVGEAVADKGEVFIGVRQKNKKGKYQIADINPSKYTSDHQTLRKYTFGQDDCLVVLAES